MSLAKIIIIIIIIIIIYFFKVGVIKVVKKLINANHLTKTKMKRKTTYNSDYLN